MNLLRRPFLFAAEIWIFCPILRLNPFCCRSSSSFPSSIRSLVFIQFLMDDSANSGLLVDFLLCTFAVLVHFPKNTVWFAKMKRKKRLFDPMLICKSGYVRAPTSTEAYSLKIISLREIKVIKSRLFIGICNICRTFFHAFPTLWTCESACPRN